MHITDIIKKPVINTEKARNLLENNEYVFIVDRRANKLQIKDAVEKLFNVKVADCTTINIMGKMKRLRGKQGRTSSYKKAIVRLASGQTIQAFEGV